MKGDFLLDSLEYVGDDLIYETRNVSPSRCRSVKRSGKSRFSRRAMLIALAAVLAVVISAISGALVYGNVSKQSWHNGLKNMEDVMEYGYLASVAEKTVNTPLFALTEYKTEEKTSVNYDFYFMLLNRNADTLRIFSIPFTNNTLRMLDKYYPVEHLGFIDDDNIYVVYKTITPDGEQTYTYILFSREEIYMDIYEDYRKKTVIRTDRCESWTTNTEIYFVSKARESSYYRELKVGENGLALSDIDVDFKIEFEYGGLRETDIKKLGDHTNVYYRWYKPLTDCVMIVDFVKQVENNGDYLDVSVHDPEDLVITNIEFCEYGSETGDDNRYVMNAPDMLADLAAQN